LRFSEKYVLYRELQYETRRQIYGKTTLGTNLKVRLEIHVLKAGKGTCTALKRLKFKFSL
jgi:hypothetical protein